MEETENLLRSWGIPFQVIQAFKDNEIQIQHFEHLKEENFKELCPALGNRIDLQTHIQNFVDSQATTTSATSVTDKENIVPNSPSPDLTNPQSLLESLLNLRPPMPDFDLKTLLQTSPGGKSLLNYYDQYQILDEKRKNRLTDIIIRHLYTHLVNYRIRHEEFNVLAAKIVTLFPKESHGTYFTRPIKKRDSLNGKSIFAKGKLVDKARNLLFSSGESKREKRTHSTDDIAPAVAAKTIKETELKELHKEDILFLQNNTEPWDVVIEKWQKTFHFRNEKEYDTVHTFLQEWTILKDQRGNLLINLDFDALYPEKALSFYMNWDIFFEKCIELKKNFAHTTQTQTLLDSLPELNDDEKIPTQLVLLAHMVPPKGRLSKKIKFSTQEAIETLFVMVNSAGDIDECIKKQMDKAYSERQTVQPFIIIQGSLQKHDALYLVIDDIRYNFKSSRKAFDLLFKSYHVLKAKYPKPSDHLFLIMQRCVYNIKTKYDNVVPYILDILNI